VERGKGEEEREKKKGRERWKQNLLSYLPSLKGNKRGERRKRGKDL